MTIGGDPYRVLGLAPGASAAEVKRAYRRLAKQCHPDSVGEGTLARFLAIQAAYEAISGPTMRSRPGGPGTRGRRPWEADHDRARATREEYREAARARTGRGATGGTGGTGATGGTSGGGASGAGGHRPKATRKATLGSTSYDEAVADPSESSWDGASWYGPSSGTYWTINPKEFADPRKHGPEYLERARRAARARPGDR